MMITLDEAATKLGLFYTELMDVLGKLEIVLDNPDSDFVEVLRPGDIDPFPGTTIDDEVFVQIQEYLGITVLPERDPLKGFSAKNYERLKAYRIRLEKWTDEWQIKNKPAYEALLDAREGYLKKKGFILPTSFDDMSLWLKERYASQNGSRPEYYLTKDFSESYFKEYHDGKKGVFEAGPNTDKNRIINLHWAFYYRYLVDANIVNEGSNKRNACKAFFEKSPMSSKDIYNKSSRLSDEKFRRKEIQERGKFFLKTIDRMLTKDGHKVARNRLTEDGIAVFGKW